jgi:hypothetical protein
MMRFFGFLTSAGLLNSLIAAFLFLHLPASHAPTLTSLMVRACVFVLIGALAGAAGSWLYWRSSALPFSADPPIPFRLFALTCGAGWVWVPAIVLLSREDSPITGPIAVAAAALLAVALRKAIPSAVALHPPVSVLQPKDRELFAATLSHPRRDPYGPILALCIYMAAYDLYNGWILDASAMFALCAFIFAWKLTLEPEPASSAAHHNSRQTGRAARRLAWTALPAILVTLFALLYGIEHRNRVESGVLANANGVPPGDDAGRKSGPVETGSASTLSGYQSIILWPVAEEKQIVPPLPRQSALLAPGTTQPLIIRFDGPYWYFQPPRKAPSPDALQAHGTPLAHDIQSNNYLPLVMEAHQSLGSSIPLARCREIELSVLNSDNRPGSINIAVLLADSSSPSNQLYLGQRPVLSSLPEHLAPKSSPAGETLRFPISLPAKIRQFDSITVMFLPNDANYDQGPKVAIQQFQLMPR